jgi:polar amino acid transport system substrate-binding protein
MKPLRLFFVCLLAYGLAACQPPAPGASTAVASPRLDRVLESGTLRVGLSAGQPPLNMTNKSGEIVGLEVDVVRALAEAMDLELELVTRPFAELLPALEKGDVDLVISGMTITAERNARVAFVGPYFISGKSVLTKSEGIANVESSDALNNPEHTYTALAGSTGEDFVKRVLPKAKLVTAPDYDTAVKMVLDDEVDAMVADFPICMLSVMRYPEANLQALTTPFTVEPLGIALPPDDPLLVNLVDNYLTTLEKTGLLMQFKAKWFTHGPWVAELR